MKEMRYAESNAEDYAQHSNPIKVSSVPVFANHQVLFHLISKTLGKLDLLERLRDSP